MSMSWQQSEPAPGLCVHPPGVASLDEAHAAIEQWEHYSRKSLDTAQRLAVEHMMAENGKGRWAARTTGRTVPRQNGKGDELEVVESWGITQRAEAIVHTAHEIPTAKSAHERMVALMESHPDLRRRLKPGRSNGITYGNGNYTIELANGGIIVYRTRTGGGGRGLDDISRLIVDEAQHAKPEQLASSTPILAANPNPQTNFVGTGGIAGVSDWWWSMRRRALAVIAGTAEAGAFAWLEHTAEVVSLDAEGKVVSVKPDPADREAWRRANPAYPGRIDDGFLVEQLAILGPDLFMREHLGIWDAEPGSSGGAIDPAAWAACMVAGHSPSGAPAYALDVSPEGKSAAIALSDGAHVEVVKHEQGTAWVVPLCVLRRDRFRELLIDPAGPAVELIAPLEAAGLKVRRVSTEEAKAACGQFLTDVNDGRVIHRGQPMLDLAVQNADRRDAGDGGWLWSRKRSAVDIAPLYAATLAKWAAGVSHPTTEAGFFTIADLLEA